MDLTPANIFVSSLESDLLPCSELVDEFDVVGLEVLFTAFEKISSRIGFSLRIFPMDRSLGLRSFL